MSLTTHYCGRCRREWSCDYYECYQDEEFVRKTLCDECRSSSFNPLARLSDEELAKVSEITTEEARRIMNACVRVLYGEDARVEVKICISDARTYPKEYRHVG